MIKAVIFDVDGVMIDSEECTALAGVQLFKELGAKVTKEDFFEFIGSDEEYYLGGVAKKYNVKIDIDLATTRLYEIYSELSKGLSAKKGITSFVKHLTDQGIKTAVATGANLIKARINLKAAGFDEDDFNYFLCGDHVKRNKPYPDIYINTVFSLNLYPSQCLVIEDSSLGIQAAKAAGCYCLAVEGTCSKELLISAGADLVISNIENIPKNIEKEFTTVKAEYLEIKAREMSKAILKNSYSPYSKFKVAAALITEKGNVYAGVNVENSSYGATICAERSTIMKAISVEGKLQIKFMVIKSEGDVAAPPCGICLQVIAEFATPDTKVELISGKGKITKYLFKDLLPNPFKL